MLKRFAENKSTEPQTWPWEPTPAEVEEWREAKADVELAKRANRGTLKKAPQGPDRRYSREVVDASTREQLAQHRLLGVEAKIRGAAKRRMDPIAQLEG